MTDDEIASLYLLSDLAFNFFPQCARTERKVSPLRGGRWVFTFTDEDVADEAICFTDVLQGLALFKPKFLKLWLMGDSGSSPE